MLAEIAAANAAFAIIKNAVQNTGDITKAGKAIGEFVFAKDALAKNGNRKKNSIWNKLASKNTHDLEEFMALEEIKQKEESLREMMQLYGRGGLWNDYVKFCAEARKNREYQKKEREMAMEQLKETILAGVLVLIILGTLSGFGYLIAVRQGLL
jgi:hypothetical protein